jgi:hypothetical protein
VSRFVVLSMIVCAACTTGCTSAHYVSKQADSGVVAIPSNTNAWPFHYRQEADELIRQHVGPDYEIVDERQVVTGVRVANNQQTQRDQTPNKKNPNMPGERVSTTDTTTTSNVTEWRITYARRGSTVVMDALPRPDLNGAAPGVQPAGGIGAAPPTVIVVPQDPTTFRQP